MRISINHIAILLIILAASQYFLVSLASPIIFGDEGYYASNSKWISENHIIPEFYPYNQNSIIKNRFDIIPIFFLFEIFGFYFGETGAKLIIPIFSVLSALVIYSIMKKLKNKIAGFFSAIVLLMTPAFVTYGVMGYTDTLLLLLSLLTINFIIKAFEDKMKVDILMSGIFLGFTILTKKSAPFLIVFTILYGLTKIKNKNTIKKTISIFLIMLLVMAPWIIRNIILYSDPCLGDLAFNQDNNCNEILEQEPEKIEGLEFEGRNLGGGTEGNLLSFGLLNYARFAHGWTILILFMIGLSYVIIKNNNISQISIITLLSTTPLILFSTQRAEDTARYLLPMNISIAIIVGLISYELYNFGKKYNKYLGYLIAILIIFSLGIYGQEKIEMMKIVKQFSPGFIEGCKWVRENTPKDSVLISPYFHHTRYQCDRTVAIAGDEEEIYLTFNKTSYEHMKLNGINYIVVMLNLVTEQKIIEAYSIDFITYIDSSSDFKKVYDNSNEYGNSGIMVYEVL